jgi:8-oxo-dGTP pyrophosphatase MutT (NUDIX family)
MSPSQNLTLLLNHHRPFDAQEKSHITETLKFLTTSKDPLDRNDFLPGHAVASALLTDPPRRHVMLVMHAKLKRWLQPGGHAEPGETDLLHVACREVAEEVGVQLDPEKGKFCDIDIHVVPARKGDPQHLHYDFRFLFEIPVAQTFPASDALEAKWFTLETAEKLELDSGLRRLIEKLK